METLYIKKPDIKMLKEQAGIVDSILTDGDRDYISPEELEQLRGLVNFCEYIADVAEGHEVVNPNKRHYTVEGRNGYYAIDEYNNPEGDRFSNCERMIESFKTKKKAETVCYHMNGLAYEFNRARGLVT